MAPTAETKTTHEVHNNTSENLTKTIVSGSINNNNHQVEKGEDDEETYGYAAQILNSCALPMVLNATIDLGVLQIINSEAGPNGLTPKELAARIQAQNPDASVMLDRMLRVLATYSVVSFQAENTGDGGGVVRRYGAAPVTKCFVPDEDGVSLAALLNLVVGEGFLQSWSKLKDAVLEGGIPFNKVYGMHCFEYADTNPKFNEKFNKAMYDHSTYIIKNVLKKYKGFEQIHQLVDVGGGLGHSVRRIVEKYPSIKGINFDLPHVIEQAPPVPGVEHISGDMFESVPTGDVIFLKWILHDWSDDHCLTLLKNCYKSLPDKGKVIVVEANITDQPETTIYARAISQWDVSMLIAGGIERTRAEFEALAMAAGFAGVKADCCVSSFWVMEFYK